ncbi:MAG: XRE family transcriptional regulator [Leifsonia xyli]|nr:MAG: XRE family transcriptional regulator [Leifsonia xyli]
MFNASRLIVARQRAGLTKKELAVRVGLDPRSISGFELGQYVPTESNLNEICRVLGFSKKFFESDDIEILESGGVSFRSMSKITSKQRDAATAAGSIAMILNDWVDREFELPRVQLPDYRDVDPEVAANSLRQYWGLGERPIKNMIYLLESKGIRVFSLVENCKEVDAFSVWRGARPFVFLNTIKSGERRRFDAAHELGHLVLHRNAAPQGVEAEKEAQSFASAFMMPEAAIRAKGHITPNMNTIMELKKEWKVSTSAMTVRLFQLKKLTYYHYNKLFIEISRSGYRTAEPDAMPPETSQVWKKVFSEMRKDGISIADLAAEIAVPENELLKLVFGLVTVGMPDEPAHSSELKGARAHLRLVK